MMSTITKDNTALLKTVDASIKNNEATKTENKVYRIFIVDDDLMVLKMLKRYFNDFSQYEITTFLSGEACLDKLSQKPDVVILDHNLSDSENMEAQLDGLDVLKEIKRTDPAVQVIMLSAQAEVQVAVDCLKRGAVNYIVKDAVMQFSIKEAVDAIAKSEELKEEIHLLSNTIKRDKLLIRGYGILTIFLCLMLYYFWST